MANKTIRINNWLPKYTQSKCPMCVCVGRNMIADTKLNCSNYVRMFINREQSINNELDICILWHNTKNIMLCCIIAIQARIIWSIVNWILFVIFLLLSVLYWITSINCYNTIKDNLFCRYRIDRIYFIKTAKIHISQHS